MDQLMMNIKETKINNVFKCYGSEIYDVFRNN